MSTAPHSTGPHSATIPSETLAEGTLVRRVLPERLAGARIKGGLRVGAASVAVAGMLVTSGVAIGAVAIADYGTLKAVTAVNVRRDPSPQAAIVGVLYLGSKVKQTGPVRNGWVPVSWNGRSAWVAANYLTGVRATESAPVSQSGGTGARRTTEILNVRRGPSTSSTQLGQLPKNTTVTLTGLVNANYSQIIYRDSRAWVATAWLTTAVHKAPNSATGGTTKVTGQARATADLMIRTAPGSNFRSLGDLPKGTVLNLTGRTSPGVVEILWQGALRWVNASYLASVGGAPTVTTPKAPGIIGVQYTTEDLNVRSSSGANASVVAVAPRGSALSVTGVVASGRAQIVYQGAVRWVSAQYLSKSKPRSTSPIATLPNLSPTYGGSEGLTGLPSNTQSLLVQVRTTYPQIKTIYGKRPDSIPDHPSGHALDLMLPSYASSTGQALGWQVAQWARENADRLDIQYVIYNQKIWNRSRDAEGWRSMANRGGDTANHKDHVHITTRS